MNGFIAKGGKVVETEVDLGPSLRLRTWLVAGYGRHEQVHPSTCFYMAMGCASPEEATKQVISSIKTHDVEGDSQTAEDREYVARGIAFWAVRPLSDTRAPNVSAMEDEDRGPMGLFSRAYVRVYL